MKEDQLNTDVSRRRWLTGSVAMAAAGGMTDCSSGTEDSDTGQDQAGPPRSELLEPYIQARLMLFGRAQTQLMFVAAKLGIADLLQDGPRPVKELAEATGSHAPSLYRAMRALVRLGVFTEPRSRHFSLTPIGELLQTDHPHSLRDVAILFGGESSLRPYANMLYSVQTGETAFKNTFGMSTWEYFQQHPDQSAVFQAAMTGMSKRDAAAVLEAYDFSEFQTIADLGGGEGLLLAAILKAYPSLRGTLLDLPSVAQAAREFLQNQGVSDRCEIMGVSFFEAVPENVDLYILKYIIHDWDDESCRKILKNCREAIAADGRVLIVEKVVTPDDSDSLVTLGDITMLVLEGGRERTEAEFRDLLSSAGFKLNRIITTSAEVSLIEGVPD